MSSTKITLQVLSRTNEEVSKVEFTNDFTDFGKSTLDVMSIAPNFPTSNIIIGSGYDLTKTNIMEQVDSAVADATVLLTMPEDRVTTPALRTWTLSYMFGPYNEVKSIKEIGIGTTPTTMCTYAGVSDHKGRPLSIELKVGERLYVTYMYQIASMASLPTNISIQGDGIDEGTVACLYRTTPSTARGYYYYDSMTDFEESHWEEYYNNFYKNGNLNEEFASSFGSSAFHDLANAGSSIGIDTMSKSYNAKIPNVQSAEASTDVLVPQHFFVDSRIQYLVAFRLNSVYCLVLNRPIEFKLGIQIKPINEIPFEVTMDEFIDPGSYS
mgnify:FL=1